LVVILFTIEDTELQSVTSTEELGSLKTETPTEIPVAQTANTKALENADHVTYAATRLRDIKAHPVAWSDPLAWQREFAAAPSPALQREVAALARQIGPAPYLSILPQAIASSDPVLRLEVARSIAELPADHFAEGVLAALKAPQEETRAEVMDVVANATPALQVEVLRHTLGSAFSDVRDRSVELLTDRPSPELFSVLLEGLRVPDPDVRAQISGAVTQIVHERFLDHESATRWWAENRERFDAMMLLAQ